MSRTRLLLLAACGAAAGCALGYYVGQRFGSVNRRRMAHAMARWRERAAAADPDGPWSDEARAALEAAVRDALRAEPALSQRGLTVRALGPGLVELAGWVESGREATRARRTALATAGVRTVVSHVLVRGVDAALESAGTRPATTAGA